MVYMRINACVKGLFIKDCEASLPPERTVTHAEGGTDLSQESYLLQFLPQVLHLPPHSETGLRGVVLLTASSAEGCVGKRNNIEFPKTNSIQCPNSVPRKPVPYQVI